MKLDFSKVWLPGAAACLLFFGTYAQIGLLPLNTNFDSSRYGFLFMSLPYLAVVPLVGAFGAYLSRRMNGSVRERILSALFPVFAFAVIFAGRIVYGLFFEGKPYTLPHFTAGLVVTLTGSIVGGLLLVLGAWPFCRQRRVTS